MAGHAPEGIGIVVVDFAAEHPSPPRDVLRRRDSRVHCIVPPGSCRVYEPERMRVKRLVDAAPAKLRQACSGRAFDDDPKENESEIAVDALFAGWREQRLPGNELHDGVTRRLTPKIARLPPAASDDGFI